jgi:hypothetical protein
VEHVKPALVVLGSSLPELLRLATSDTLTAIAAFVSDWQSDTC